jgi:hypothetical protein
VLYVVLAFARVAAIDCKKKERNLNVGFVVDCSCFGVEEFSTSIITDVDFSRIKGAVC